ncbi:MAG TPA: site-specific integrase [Rhizomicrobium sp.]
MGVHGVDASGRRVKRFYTVKGDRAAALAKLSELVKAGKAGELPNDKKLVSDVIDAWDKTLSVSAKTAERYRELVKHHIRPHLGDLRMRSVRASRIDQFYADLLAGRDANGVVTREALAPRTIGHVHRLVVQIFGLAVRDRDIDANPATAAIRPDIENKEIEILTEQEARDVLSKLRCRNTHGSSTYYRIVFLALASGMRRGEILGARWKDLNFETAELRVQQSVEQTKAGLRFKSPKSKAGRRTITLPAAAIAELRLQKSTQAAERLSLGLGKDADDALIFRQVDGSPLVPNNVTTEWRRLVESLHLPKVSFHAFRHTHASQLIASGMDVLTISRRLGHSNASITLNIYGHLFAPTDKTAAAVMDRAFGSVFS